MHSQRNSHDINFNRGPYYTQSLWTIRKLNLFHYSKSGEEELNRAVKNVLKSRTDQHTARWNYKDTVKDNFIQINEFYSEYESFSHGEAPENLLAVENAVTGAIHQVAMQSDG